MDAAAKNTLLMLAIALLIRIGMLLKSEITSPAVIVPRDSTHIYKNSTSTAATSSNIPILGNETIYVKNEEKASTIKPVHEELAGTNATRKIVRYITNDGQDGIGHQLLGMFSCMMLSRVDPTVEYVLRNDVHIFGHECKGCLELYNNFANAEGVPRRPPGMTVKGVDNCMGELKRFCCQKNETMPTPNEACNSHRTALAERWRSIISSSISYTLPYDALIHLRLGDMKQNVNYDRYRRLLATFPPHYKIGINTEFPEEAKTFVDTFPNRTELLPSMGTLKTWEAMVLVPTLVLGDSSFSITAAIVRTNLTFSEKAYAKEGRYDWHKFACYDEESGWFFETGGYANTSNCAAVSFL